MPFSVYTGSSVASGVSAISKQYLCGLSDSADFRTIFPNLPGGKEKGGTGGIFTNPTTTGAVLLIGDLENQITAELTVSQALTTGVGIEKAENYEFKATGTAIGDLQITKLKELNEKIITFYIFDYKSISSLAAFSNASVDLTLASTEYVAIPLMIDDCQLSIIDNKHENGKIARVNFTVSRKYIPSLTARIWQTTIFAKT
jgi:hypothetical protein